MSDKESEKKSKLAKENEDNFSENEPDKLEDLQDDKSNNSSIKNNKNIFPFGEGEDEKNHSSDEEYEDEKQDIIPISDLKNKKEKSFDSNNESSNSDKSKSKSDKKSESKNSNDDSEEKDKVDLDGNDSQSHQKLPEFTRIEQVEEFFRDLRAKFKLKEKDGVLEQDSLWEDPEFVGDSSLFHRNNEMPKKYEGIEIQFERPNSSGDQGDNQKLEFFSTDSSNNIIYQFKIKKGMLTDRYFVGCILMLFKAKEEFFSNLVIDYENASENIKYGFCGFQFFINGEWKYVVIDTSIPWHQNEDMALSSANSVKPSFWLTLICKAYAKVFKSYDVLNDVNVSIKNVLVDLTGGISKKITINNGSDGNEKSDNEGEKRGLYEELKRIIHQGYLVGCMKYEEQEEDEMDDSQSEAQEEDDMLTNHMYVILDVQDCDGHKLLYLNNSWGKGKFTGSFGPEDEAWETNKGMKEKLGYENQTDGTFWIPLNEWYNHFNTVYYCRIFPSTWSQFCIPGSWMGLLSGGAPMDDKTSTVLKKNVTQEKRNTVVQSSNSPELIPLTKEKKKAEIKYREIIKRIILPESDDRWFLNPQYKIELKPKTKLIISLMQEDEKLSQNPYQTCNFIIMLCSGKYTRVWDIKKENIIKKALNTAEKEANREIICHLNYFEVLQKLAEKRKKKVITKYESVYINLIPYQEYNVKYEIEKSNQTRIFKQISKEGIYWLRIFSSENIGILELPPSYEKTIDHKFSDISYGGSRFMPESSQEKLIENQFWPLNPQFLLKFDVGTSLKVILRKTSCLGNTNEESRIGIILTKPDLGEYNTVPIKSLKATGNYKKNDNILRVLESSQKILETKKIDYQEIDKKLFFNMSEWVVESPYKNCYSASLFSTFNKIDSPILVIPTLENYKDTCDFKLSSNFFNLVFSNKPVEVISLNNEDSKLIISEWKDSNSGGSHLAHEQVKKDTGIKFAKKILNWQDNPKFNLIFESKERIPEVEFTVKISRSEFIWSKKATGGMVNSMMGLYLFQFENGDKWKNHLLNAYNIEFLPKNEIQYNFKFNKVDPRGFILMPATYGSGVTGPFSLLVKCKEKYNIKEFIVDKSY